jgi:5-oxoprolinase (ATP-hydrolysing) subunit A
MNPIANTVDLNSDMGESFGRWTLGADEALMQYVSSVNIACGFHAGDPTVMRKTVQLAKKYNVAIGAHPGYFDVRGFGRFDMDVPLDVLQNDIIYQLGALQALCNVENVKLSYVKPHGALYNRMARDENVARVVLQATREFNASLPVLLLANSVAENVGRELGLTIKREGFIDRAYLADGSLQSRSEAGSVIHDVAQAAERALQLVQTKSITAIDGSSVMIQADSLCIHGDSPNAVAMAKAVRERLEQAGIGVSSFA